MSFRLQRYLHCMKFSMTAHSMKSSSSPTECERLPESPAHNENHKVAFSSGSITHNSKRPQTRLSEGEERPLLIDRACVHTQTHWNRPGPKLSWKFPKQLHVRPNCTEWEVEFSEQLYVRRNCTEWEVGECWESTYDLSDMDTWSALLEQVYTHE